MSEFEHTVFEDEEYVLNLPYHLLEAGMADNLLEILIELEFIEYKLLSLNSQALIDDYNSALIHKIWISEDSKSSLKLIRDAIQKSAHILAEDKTQLVNQLLGRLVHCEKAEITAICLQARRRKEPWLRLLSSSLSQVGEPLIYTLTGHTGEILALAITPDNKQIVSGSWDKTIKVWSLEKGEELFTLEGHTDLVTALAITPDSDYIVSGSRDETIKVWGLREKKEILTITNHPGRVTALAITLKDNLIISGSSDNTIRFWNLTSGKEVMTEISILQLSSEQFKHTNGINTLAIASDGRQIISGSWDNTIKIWNRTLTNDGHFEVFTLKNHASGVKALAVASKLNLMVSGSWDRTIKVWDVKTGIEIYSFCDDIHHKVEAVAITQDGKLAVSGGESKTLNIWNLETGKELNTISGHVGVVYCLEITPDGKKIISASEDRTIKVWDLERVTKPNSSKGHTKGVHSLAITPDGKKAISGSYKTIKVWNLETREELFSLTGHTDWVKALAVIHDSKNLISASIVDRDIKIWNLESKEQSDSIEIEELSGKLCLQLVSDNEKVIVGGIGNYIKIISLKTKKELFRLAVNTEVAALAITPDGKNLISGSWDNTLTVWNLETRKELFTFTGHTDWVNAIAITPDGKQVISASKDTTLKIWSLENGEEIITLDAHNDSVNSVAVSLDGKRAVSSSGASSLEFAQGANSLKVWDLTSPEVKVIASFNTDSAVHCCAVAPDGRTIVAGEESGRVHFLRLEGEI